LLSNPGSKTAPGEGSAALLHVILEAQENLFNKSNGITGLKRGLNPWRERVNMLGWYNKSKMAKLFEGLLLARR